MEAPEPGPQQSQAAYMCGKCHEAFCSRNELFIHLDAADHFVDGITSSTSGSAAKGNEALRAYYARQLRETATRQHDASLWERNYAILAEPLPHTFRGSASSCFLPHVIEKLQTQPNTELLPLPLDASMDIAWRLAARDAETAKIIAAGQDLGIVHRQEVCSMLPPLVLDVQPDHIVLDLCAAPGSKTLQLLDNMNCASKRAAWNGVRGLLVANDVSRERAMTIAHRSRRGCSRTALALLCTDARHFPALYRRAYRIKYDRILCDVPCSGDGTLRKSASMWSRWSVKDGLSIHLLQLAILKRGLELLADGGRLVYSTCSLNPIEGEAVVAAAIRHFGGAARLLHVDRDRLRVVENGCEGLTCWEVPSPDYARAADADTDSAAGSAMWMRYDDVPTELRRDRKSGAVSMSSDKDCGSEESPLASAPPATVEGQQQHKRKAKAQKNRKRGLLCPTMFPPTGQPGVPPLDCDAAFQMSGNSPAGLRDAREAAEELRKCVRVLPSQGDGGGFFIALLERTRARTQRQPGDQQQNQQQTDIKADNERLRTEVQPVLQPDEVQPHGSATAISGEAKRSDWGEAGRTSRAFLFDPVAPELAASFIEWWGVHLHVAQALAQALRIDRVSGRLLLPSPELSLLKVSKRHLRQRLVVEAGLCLCAEPPVGARAALNAEASASEDPASTTNEEEEAASRWILFDEAAEYMSRVASRRVLQCTASGFAQLLHDGRLSRDALELGKCVNQVSFSTCFKAPECSLDLAGDISDASSRSTTKEPQLVTGGVLLCCDLRQGNTQNAVSDSDLLAAKKDNVVAVSGRLQKDGVICLANDRTKHALLHIMAVSAADI